MLDDATLEILLKWKEEGAAAHAEVMRKLGEIAAAQTAANVATAASNATAAGGVPAWLGIAAAIAVASAALAPFVAIVGSAAVILTTFAFAGAGMAALLGGLALGATGLVGAMVLLANQFGWVNNAMAQFTQAWQRVGLDLAAAAAGSVNQILLFLASFAGYAEYYAKQVIAWFGKSVPDILDALGAVFRDLLPTLDQFGRFLGKTFDQQIPQFFPLFQSGIETGVRAATYFITNLAALSSWFIERLPTYGPIVQQVFGFLGQVILGAASIWGRFSDWLVSVWPYTVKIAQIAVADIADQWNKWSPALKPLIDAALPAMGLLLIYMAQHAGALVPVLINVIVIATGLVVGIMAIVTAAMVVIEWLDNMGLAFGRWSLKAVQDVRGVIDALNKLPGVNLPMPQLPGQGGTTSNSDNISNRSAGPQGYGSKAATTVNNTFYMPSQSDPQTTAAYVARVMRHQLTT